MSINKELKFTKWYEENVVGKYEDAPYNYFTDDEWFYGLPNELKKSIIKVNEKSYDDLLYDMYLELLDGNIRSYIFDKRNGDYSDDDIQYLLQYLDYHEYEYSKEDDKDEI